MELPADEEDDEEVVGIPELLKLGPAPLLASKENHYAEAGGHDPASGAGPSGKVGVQKGDDFSAKGLGVRVCICEAGKIDHVCPDVHGCEDDHRPCRGLVKGEVFVERNDMVEGCTAEEGDKVATNGEKNEDDVDMEDESSSTGDGCVYTVIEKRMALSYKERMATRTVGGSESRTGISEVIL